MGGIIRSFGRVTLAILILTAVSGCGILDFLDEDAQKPLEGKRISILLHERTLSADPELSSVQIVLPAPTPNAEWPQAGGYPNHAMHHIQAADSLQRVWSTDIGSGADSETRMMGSPVIAGGIIYTLDSQTNVSAYDSKTGNRLWITELTPDEEDDGHMGGGVAFEDGQIFVTTGFNQIIALNAKDGTRQWSVTLDAPMRTAPTARGGRVFVLTITNELQALDARDGKMLWTHTGLNESASLLGYASPAVDKGVVVVPYSSGELVALSVDKGRVLWQDSISAIRRTDAISGLAHIRGRPVIDRGRVIAISNSGMMATIDLRTGRRIWDNRIGGMESPWVAGDYVFVLTNDAEIAAVSRNDGRIFWVRGLPKFTDPEDQEGLITWTGPILVSDRLLVAGSHGKVMAVSPYDGQILGSEDMPDGITVPPVVANGQVLFLANDAELIAYQ